MTIKKPFGNMPRPVKKIDLETSEVIKIYPSVLQASKELEVTCARTGITSCCQHQQNSAYGFKWEYVD